MLARIREVFIVLEAGYNWHLAKPVDPNQLSLVATAVAEGPTQTG
jgi:hypothetical protein